MRRTTMRTARSRAARLGAVAAVATLALSACGGGSIDEQTKANESQAAEGGGECGDLSMAVNPWVGYEASAYVVGTVAEQELGCSVEYKELKEDVSWQGFGTGEVDVVIEDWGHPDLEKKFFAEEGDGTATDFGPQGNVGIIGWFVPPWLAEEHPDILDYPETELKKIVSTEWSESDSTAVDLVQNFTWTNEDQNVVAGYIASDGMSPEDAAAKWVDENQDKVDAWLG